MDSFVFWPEDPTEQQVRGFAEDVVPQVRQRVAPARAECCDKIAGVPRVVATVAQSKRQEGRSVQLGQAIHIVGVLTALVAGALALRDSNRSRRPQLA